MEAKVSRAMNLDLPEQDVVDGCNRRRIQISAMEALPAGGTHLVCLTIEGADQARALFSRAIILGPVRRASFQRASAFKLQL